MPNVNGKMDSFLRIKHRMLVNLSRILPDKTYLKILYKRKFGRKLDFKSPKSFNEKIQWLKIYDRKPSYTIMVDKCKAKDYVSKIIGEEHIIKTLGVWHSFDDIDFSSLPNQFVLKCTHDSEGLIICRDKKSFDVKKARKKINSALKRKYFFEAREWPYKNVVPMIIAEEYMDDGSGKGLTDYKFYCFNGDVKFLYISKGLENHATANISFVNLDWTFAPFARKDYKQFDRLPQKPAEFEKMISFAKTLSRDIPFLRVDLYDINGVVYFSELTFSPCAGFTPFESYEQDLKIGSFLDLPNL